MFRSRTIIPIFTTYQPTLWGLQMVNFVLFSSFQLLYLVNEADVNSIIGNNDHDAAGKLIGSQGQDWTAKHWREVDM